MSLVPVLGAELCFVVRRNAVNQKIKSKITRKKKKSQIIKTDVWVFFVCVLPDQTTKRVITDRINN